MATLRHGVPVEAFGYFDKQGKADRFPRYLRLCDVVLSNHHDVHKPPSWQVSVLECPMLPGPRAREFRVHLPKRVVSYFARDDHQHAFWCAALQRAASRIISRFYRLGRVFGSGAFSTVRYGEDVNSAEVFAVKEIDRAKAGADLGAREVEIMLRLKHPGIVNTHDIFQDIDKLYLVIEYVRGGELFDIIADQGSLSEQRASQVIRDIILAVRYLHKHNVVHCDIKPENILCESKTWPLQIKLCDFGLAGVVDPSVADVPSELRSPPSTPGTPGSPRSPAAYLTAMIGTPGYCAPEVVRKKQYGPAVDMWAVGVILYILLSGRMPFYGKTDVETLRRTANGQYSFPPREWANISEDAKSLIRGLLQLNPEKRLTAEAALHHGWLSDNLALSTEPIKNDLSQLHSRLRKFRKAARAAILVERMRDLIGTSARARAGNPDNAGDSTASSPVAPTSNGTRSNSAIFEEPSARQSAQPQPQTRSSSGTQDSCRQPE